MKGLNLLQKGLYLGSQRGRCCLGCPGRLLKLLFHLLIMFHKPLGCKRLNTPYTGGNTSLGNNLKICNGACIRHMGAAAELCGEISHAHHAHLISVFFTEQSHGSCFLGFLQCHNLGDDRKGCLDFLVHQILHLLNLIRCHG